MVQPLDWRNVEDASTATTNVATTAAAATAVTAAAVAATAASFAPALAAPTAPAAVLWAIMTNATMPQTPNEIYNTSSTSSNYDINSSSRDAFEQLVQQQPAHQQLHATTSPSSTTSTTTIKTGRRKRGSRPSLTNSQRGHLFRAKQERYELSLLESITGLQGEVHRLECTTRDLHHERSLQTRNSSTGSLVQLMRLYHELFRLGSIDVRLETTPLHAPWRNELVDLQRRQREFLRFAVDPDVLVGKQHGVHVLAELWHRYTRYHDNFRLHTTMIDVTGSVESPIVTAHGVMQARYTRQTLANLFPHVMHDEALVQRFIGLKVTYAYRSTYMFTNDGRLAVSAPEVDFIGSLVAAGASLADVSVLMQQARIADQHVLGPVASDGSILPTRIEEIVESEMDAVVDSIACSVDGENSCAGAFVSESHECLQVSTSPPTQFERDVKLRVGYLID